MSRKGFVILPLLLIVVFFGLLGYFLFKNQINLNVSINSNPSPTPTEPSNNLYQLDKYSFIIPSDFNIESEHVSGDVAKSIVIANKDDVSFELVVNEGGRGVEFANRIVDDKVVVDNKEFQRLILKGTGPSERCPNCDNQDDYTVWIILENYQSPQQGIKDLIWYSFDTQKVGYDNAMNILENILDTFKVSN